MDLRIVTPLDPAIVFRKIAAIHETELKAGLLAELGPQFLFDFYRFAAAKADLVVATEKGEVVGFVLVTRDREIFQRAYMWSRGPWVAWTLLLRGPKAIRRAMSLRSHMTGSNALPHAELLSIAVHPQHRRNGIAKALVKRAGWITPTFQVTASHTQPEAMRFYGTLGKLEHETDIGGLKSYTFRVEIPA